MKLGLARILSYNMNLDTYKIHGELYQGSIPPGGRVIADAGFDVLVLCAWENQDASFYDDVEVILAPGDDVNETPITLKN